MKVTRENGQVGLIVLLITVVMLTVGVSVASRSVSELKLSRQEQESTRALDVAESGVEDLLSKNLTVGSNTNVVLPDGNKYDYTVSSVNTLSSHVEVGHTAELTLSNTGNDNTIPLTITYSPSTCPNAPAIELAVFNKAGAVTRTTYDQCVATRSDNFGNAAISNFNVTGLMARIKVLYFAADLTVSGGVNLPVQTYTIKSSATIPGGATRVVEVTKPIAALPSIFDYVLFSGSTLVK